MKYLTLLFLLLLIGCNGEEIENIPRVASVSCDSATLEVIPDGQPCEDADNLFICDVIVIEETQFIDADAYRWSPDICALEIDDNILFTNSARTTAWKVVERGHYISQERVFSSCDISIEHATYLCQKNEVIYVSFHNNLLGRDTLTLELRTVVQDHSSQEKRNIISLYQDRTNSPIRNFWLRHYIGSGYYEQIWQTSHQSITLNGTVYNDVVEYAYGAHIHAVPDYRYYVQKDIGILGFEVEKTLWLRE